MDHALLNKRVVIAICCIAALCCAAYFQLFNGGRVLPDKNNYARANESEAVRNAALVDPHRFGIEMEDVSTLRTVSSVPSAR